MAAITLSTDFIREPWADLTALGADCRPFLGGCAGGCLGLRMAYLGLSPRYVRPTRNVANCYTTGLRNDGVHCHAVQTPPCHRIQRRACRTVVLATHTPLTRTLPAPQAYATWVVRPSAGAIGGTVIAFAEAARANTKAATAIHLIIFASSRAEYSPTNWRGTRRK